MSYITQLLGMSADRRNMLVMEEAQQNRQDAHVDTRSPFERVRDGYSNLQGKYADRLVQINRTLEQAKTDKEECEAILMSLEAAMDMLNNQVVERGLLGNDVILKGINDHKD